jgi:superfamily II DNA or RNA helicase
VQARHVLGLSATLVRRDGLQPILFMQCGPIRHTAQRPAGAPQTLELVSRAPQLPALPADLPIQELMRRLAEDQRRTECIVAEALAAWEECRKLLLLSERTDHITAIADALAEQVPNLFLLHGRLSARQRSATLAALQALQPSDPRQASGPEGVRADAARSPPGEIDRRWESPGRHGTGAPAA